MEVNYDSDIFSDDEYNTDDDEFLLHRDSDELQLVMKQYEQPLKTNLYKQIEIKVNPNNNEELEELIYLYCSGSLV